LLFGSGEHGSDDGEILGAVLRAIFEKTVCHPIELRRYRRNFPPELTDRRALARVCKLEDLYLDAGLGSGGNRKLTMLEQAEW
jgi:hypothetical protein